MKFVVLIVSAVGLSAAAQAFDWGDDKSEFSDPKTQGICRALKTLQFPAGDRPSATTSASLKDCDPDALYYGIGVPRDPVKARFCAFTQFNTPRDNSFHGARAILMTIYANGSGVPRNLDLATHLACGMEDAAPAEHISRINGLQDMKTLGARAPVFDVCDDATSGLATGYCAAHSQSIAAEKRKVEIAAITARWTTAERTAFAALEKARDAYRAARGERETDVSGSGRVLFVIDAEEGVSNGFLKLLKELDAGKGTVAPALAAADRELNQVYRRIQNDPEFSAGTVNRTDIRDTQRIWLRYRDAWLALAKVKYPALSQEGLNARLTAERTEILKEEFGG